MITWSKRAIPGLSVLTFYLAFIVIGLFLPSRRGQNGHWVGFGVWLGLLGWCLQCLIDFSLYVPLSLPGVRSPCMGWLLGTRPSCPKQAISSLYRQPGIPKP